jgi:hypothetical protein
MIRTGIIKRNRSCDNNDNLLISRKPEQRREVQKQQGSPITAGIRTQYRKLKAKQRNQRKTRKSKYSRVITAEQGRQKKEKQGC